MDSGQSKITKPKLARSQVRLRVLAALLLLLSPFGVMNVWAIGKVLRARHAAARVRSLGGQVSLLPKQGELLVDPEYAYNESMVLGWHRAAFGDTSALRVSFSGSRITDADLVCLDGFRRIYMLSLDNTLVTDAGLDFLAARSEIQTLSLKGNNITDAGLKLLEGLANLKSLDLSDTKVTDQGLAHLEGLGMLTELNLARTQITDAELDRVKKIPHLQAIHLEGTRVSEAARDRLQKLCQSRIPPDDG